ncbi:MAG: 30S ribosomal protein S12 methylthiotransferase RimO [Lachnospiraceae bacterium]|nr:30S ribosomal protein S12 methylthiotransferase RimO [Lachnospiraceae bacterium]
MKISFVSLGCDKNLVDSEMMTGELARAGYEFTDDETQADIVVVNTCCFISDAKEESIQTLLELGELRKQGKLKILAACGCLAERYKDEILKEIPEIDVCVGTLAIDRIVEAIDGALKGTCSCIYEDIDRTPPVGLKRIVTTGGHYAYLKIAEGCDKHCTYCVIPSVRGRFRSIPMEELIRQAGELSSFGVKELILVAQETTLYGIDIYGRKSLHILINELSKIEGIHWIRLLYCYPEEIYDELIECIAGNPKVCHYLDMPIQHISDNILNKMGRQTTEARLRQNISKLRERIPDIALRTSLICGFPGEGEADFEKLYRFVNEMEFDRLGCFTYSKEENTPAAEMPGQIEEEEKQRRKNELMELQQAVSYEKSERFKGKRLDVIIEGKLSGEDTYVCRTYRDAPDVDGYLFLNTDKSFMSGDFARVIVTGFNEYDLTGELYDENESAE